MCKNLFLFTILFFIFCNGWGQTTISGKIYNAAGKSLSGATVTISKDSTASILAYGISDADGSFRIDLDTNSENLLLKVSYLGYATWTITIQNQDQQLEAQLTESSEELKEVVVEANIIEQRGDTLSYSVAAFMDQKDRVIGDVIKKMPGIEIMPTGRIFYQGKPIQKYYIEGLDLLEGRYSLANNNISAEDVSQVQVLENHQPIKVLDSLVFSERASLNIKLKKDVSVSGTAEVGSGFSPLLWKTKLTPMIFTKNQQAIVTYQSNNTSHDVAQEIRDFSADGFGRQEFNSNRKNWLSIKQVAAPPFSRERWLDNNVHLGSANYLIRLKKDVVLKANISYLNDAQEQIGNTQTRFFTPTDSIDIIEKTNNHLFINTLQSQFILERNTKENYLKNELEINSFWDSQSGNIGTENSMVQQQLSNPFFMIRNKLRLLEPVGKQLVTFRSNTGYTEANQSLLVMPGQFADLLNEGEAFSAVEQTVESSSFFTDNSTGFTKKIKDITISPEVGFSLSDQKLNSQLTVFDTTKVENLNGNYHNNLDFLSSRVYFTSQFVYKKNYWNIRLTTPLNYRIFKIEDTYLKESQNVDRLTFEPSLYVKKELSAFWETAISVNFSNNFGSIDQLYYGFILTNYRNLQRYNAPLSESFAQDYTYRISYRNPLHAIFANFSYTYNKARNNLLYQNRITDAGALIFEVLEQENDSYFHRFRASASKYFNELNSTLSLGSSLRFSEGIQFLNQNVIDIKNQNFNFDVKLQSEITSWLSANYHGDFNYFQTQIGDRELDQIHTQQHELDLFFYVSGNQYFSIDSEYYFNNVVKENRNNYSLNLNYQYTFAKYDLDVEISWNNILNTEEFVRVSNNDFSYIQSTYQLRPSQLFLSLRFSL